MRRGLLPIKLPKTRAQHRQTEPQTLFQTTLSVLQNHRSSNAITRAAATRAPSWINPSGRPPPFSLLQRLPRGTLERRGAEKACACPYARSINSIGQEWHTSEPGRLLSRPRRARVAVLAVLCKALAKWHAGMPGVRYRRLLRTRTNAGVRFRLR